MYLWTAQILDGLDGASPSNWESSLFKSSDFGEALLPSPSFSPVDPWP